MSSDPREARELLAFYRDAGVDALLGETAVDRMADEPAAPPPAAEPRDVPKVFYQDRAPRSGRAPAGEHETRASAPLPAPDVAAVEAREAAKNAKSLDELRALLESFTGCGLRATATQLVFAD